MVADEAETRAEEAEEDADGEEVEVQVEMGSASVICNEDNRQKHRHSRQKHICTTRKIHFYTLSYIFFQVHVRVYLQLAMIAVCECIAMLRG